MPDPDNKNILSHPIKLEKPFPNVSYFNDNQVLTATQLNNVIHHLSNQERMTRVWLIGTGILCGLKLSVEEEVITISAGCGITTDGDLLTLSTNREFTKVRAFDNSLANYINEGVSLESEDEEVFELIDDLSPDCEDCEDDPKALTEDVMKNKVVVLYVESYLNKSDLCSNDNCDNSQQVQINELRVLLVPEEQVKELPKPISETVREIPEIYPTRVKIQNVNIDNRSHLHNQFVDAIKATKSALTANIQSYKNLNSVVSNQQIESLISKLPDPTSSINLNIQKIYQFYDDFSKALREFRASLFQACSGCVPTIENHPKHLLLGYAKTTPAIPPIEYRHSFRDTSCESKGSAPLNQAYLHWKRLVHLVNAFDSNDNPSQITILPSKSPSAPLGDRCIPHYYGTSYQGLWNIERYLQGIKNPATLPYTKDTTFSEYSWEPDFYRIEGVHGQPVDTALKSIEALKQNYNLSFKVLTVQVEKSTRWVHFPPIRFPDLDTFYEEEQALANSRLGNLELYTSTLTGYLQSKDASSFDESNEDYNFVNAQLGLLKQSVNIAKASPPQTLFKSYKSPVPSTQYRAAISDTLSISRNINEKVGLISPTVFQNPIDEIEKAKPDLKINTIDTIFKRRWEKIAELSTFETFAKHYPGMEAMGGVPKGGTLILAYTENENEDQREVVMDFCLPYFVEVRLEDVETEEPEAEEPTIPDLPIPIPPVLTPRPIPYPYPDIEPIPINPPEWGDIYTVDSLDIWRADKILPRVVERIIETQTPTFIDDAVTQIDLQINENFQAVRLLSNEWSTPITTTFTATDVTGLTD